MNHSITKQIKTHTAHRLMNYDGKCSHLHGHTYLWELEVESIAPDLGVQELDGTGFVCDFADLKRVMKHVIYDPFDHATVLWKADPLFEILSNVRATNDEPHRIIGLDVNPTAEHFAAWTGSAIDMRIRNLGLQVVEMRCWETPTSFARWRPMVG